MDWIAKSSLIRDLKRDGDWEVQFGANRADYRCVTCKGQVEASIEVIAPYTAGDFPTLSQRYLAGRRLYCAELVRRQLGRCLWTASSPQRFLGGFISAQELAGRRVIEIVFFNRDWENGQELIRGLVIMDAEAESAGDLVGRFDYYMARLTRFY
ncbi:MAG: hypothetical protein AB3N24_03360 [Leisingera sp.]